MAETAEQRMAALGLQLPEPMQTASLPFELIRIEVRHAYLAGHVLLAADGGMARPLGKVGMAELPFSVPVEIEAELLLRSESA